LQVAEAPAGELRTSPSSSGSGCLQRVQALWYSIRHLASCAW
jgi:hypothetical protein